MLSVITGTVPPLTQTFSGFITLGQRRVVSYLTCQIQLISYVEKPVCAKGEKEPRTQELSLTLQLWASAAQKPLKCYLI